MVKIKILNAFGRVHFKKIIALLLIVLLVLPLTGCWNAREINELAFVLSLGLDKADNGFKVTAQIAKPETYSKTPSGGGGGAAEKEKPFWIISAEGKTIFDAVRNMASFSSRRIFWSHIKVIIMSEEVAKKDIHEIMDYFSRNPELRFRTWIAVTPDNAGSILEEVPIMEKDPSQNIEKLIEKTRLTGKASAIMIKDFLESYMNPYLNPVASRIVLIEKEGKKVPMLEGAAAFGKHEFTGWLSDKETRGYLWIENKINSSVKVINCPFDNKPVTLEIKNGKTKIKSEIINGIPRYTIKVKASAKITEKVCNTEFTNFANLHKLQDTMAASIRDDIQSAVDAAKRLDTDILDLSGSLHRQHKKEWKKVSSDWSEIFSKSMVNIEVTATIPDESLLAKSVEPVEQAPARNSRKEGD